MGWPATHPLSRWLVSSERALPLHAQPTCHSPPARCNHLYSGLGAGAGWVEVWDVGVTGVQIWCMFVLVWFIMFCTLPVCR